MDVKSAKNHGRRSVRHFNFGDNYGRLMRAILASDVCAVAAATCRFLVLGKNANGNEYGLGVRTFMQTFGRKPEVGDNCIQDLHNWVELDSHESASIVLNCFGGISMTEVYDRYGMPVEGESYSLDLVDIVEALRPGLLRQADGHAIITTVMAGSLVDGGPA